MGRELGRISGPLLAENLRRNGSDLAFETQLLYLNVSSKYLGINTSAPAQALTVNGVINVANQLVDQEADINRFIFNTSTIQHLSNAIYFHPNQATTPVVTVPSIVAGLITVTGNSLSAGINNNFNINTTGTGKLVSNTSVLVNGDLHTTGNITFDGNITLGNATTDTVTFTADINSSIIPKLNSSDDLGSTSLTWRRLYAHNATLTNQYTGQLYFHTNVLDISAANTDLQLSSSGTGLVKFNNNVAINQNLSVLGNLHVASSSSLAAAQISGTLSIYNNTLDSSWLSFDNTRDTIDQISTGNYNQTGSSSIVGNLQSANIILNGVSSTYSNSQLQISSNTITTVSNADLILSTTGVVYTGSLKIAGDTISNVAASPANDLQRSIVFAPKKSLVVSSTRFLQIPYTDSSIDTASVTGAIRQNDITNLYEGYQSYGYDSFINVYDVAKTTSITPGATDHTLKFTTNGQTNTTITSTGVNTVRLDAGNVSFTGSTISNKVSSRDITLLSTSGNVYLNRIPFNGSSITNPLNTPLTFINNGNGYLVFSGTSALLYPVGSNGDKPASPEIGMTRYNTNDGNLEIYGSNGWQPYVGTSTAVATLQQVQEACDIMAVVFG
jgi:hypothetical protein